MVVSGGNTPSRYLWNNDTKLFDPVDPQQGYESQSLEQISGGRYRVANTLIWDTQENRAAGDIRPTQPNNLVAYPSGHLELYVPTPVSEVNQRFYANAGHAVGASFDGYDNNGIAYHFDLDYSLVAPPGKILYYNGENDWRTSYKWETYDPNNPDVRTRYGDSYYYPASNQETLEYMLRGLLEGRYRNDIEDMVNAGMEDANGEPINTVSDAVAFLVSTNLDSISAARFTYLDV